MKSAPKEDLRDVVRQTHQDRRQSAPVKLRRGHTIRAHLVDPELVLDLGHHVLPVLLEHLDPFSHPT